MAICLSKEAQGLQHLVEAPFVLLFGGVVYYSLELLWRGRSHWSMALCGALCFWFLYRLNRAYPRVPMTLRALTGATVITLVELLAGCLLNLVLRLDVWDYSEMPFHFMGQICIPYSLLWFLLCFPVSGISYLIRRVVFLSDD
jgi:hypothetical protein